jgi:formyl-CoA transferase
MLAGSFTTRLLGDMGAEIIKVEALGRPDLVREWVRRELEGMVYRAGVFAPIAG